MRERKSWIRVVDDGLTRRGFVTGAAALAALAALSRAPVARAMGVLPAPFPPPFALGIASGEPTSQSVVLWTRLAPDPLNGGGMPPVAVPVKWEVAVDEAMQKVVRTGVVNAVPESAHTVHARVSGLAPDRWYWYRFIVGGEASPVGRTRTFPLPNASPARMRFAFASCQSWDAGFYTAYRHMADEDLDFVVHVGDYIYEGGVDPNAPRSHDGPEPKDLPAYRNRHALYKTDPYLQAIHAKFPFIPTFDDHEVENNYAGDRDENGSPPDVFLARRAAAYRAYWEHMPIGSYAVPVGPDMRLYRSLRFGRLAEFAVLDTRQYRSPTPCDSELSDCPARFDPSRTMTGPKQEQWLLRTLELSPATWRVLAQQVIMAQFNLGLIVDPEGTLFNLDQWDGYPAARNRILGHVLSRGISNVVVLTGDFHLSFVADLKADFGDPASATVATEFVGTSITSGFPANLTNLARAATALNTHFKFFDAGKGYVRCEVDPMGWRSDYRIVDSILDVNAGIRTLASFHVEESVPGAVRI